LAKSKVFPVLLLNEDVVGKVALLSVVVDPLADEPLLSVVDGPPSVDETLLSGVVVDPLADEPLHQDGKEFANLL
jgi:hypothetical protein